MEKEGRGHCSGQKKDKQQHKDFPDELPLTFQKSLTTREEA